MKKVLAIILALTLVLSFAVLFTGCGGKKEEPVSEEPEITEEITTESTEAESNANLPKAGDVVTLGAAKLTIPEGWSVETYREGDTIELEKDGVFMSSVEISLGKVYGDEHAKEWADAINNNYGGDKEIDHVTLAGKDFYRVKADAEQNICFTDLDESTYLKVSVMFLPWEDGEPVLNALTIG